METTKRGKVCTGEGGKVKKRYKTVSYFGSGLRLVYVGEQKSEGSEDLVLGLILREERFNRSESMTISLSFTVRSSLIWVYLHWVDYLRSITGLSSSKTVGNRGEVVVTINVFCFTFFNSQKNVHDRSIVHCKKLW